MNQISRSFTFLYCAVRLIINELITCMVLSDGPTHVLVLGGTREHVSVNTYVSIHEDIVWTERRCLKDADDANGKESAHTS